MKTKEQKEQKQGWMQKVQLNQALGNGKSMVQL